MVYWHLDHSQTEMEHSLIKKKYIDLREMMLSERNPDGYWTGRLSSSALSTAVAIVALKIAGNDHDKKKIKEGFNWLCRNINLDGGYGDTPESVSNVSTTLLCYAAITFCKDGENGKATLEAMDRWLRQHGVAIDSGNVTTAILNLYGKDRTFSIPIISMLTLCGAIPASSLKKVPILPFELTLLPASFYRFVNLQVVSYALPALIGVGIYLHRHRKRTFLRSGRYRNLFVSKSIEKLNSMVPQSGGFLEAIPLTGFVAMCLIASGEKQNHTVLRGLDFLRTQQRDDGSWPIDSDLSTWVTTLSIKALGKDLPGVISAHQLAALRSHLLGLQFKTVHPFNSAKPGGWGWTSFSGSVPDADDTPGAILALLELYAGTEEENRAIINGCVWLSDLQNSDGGLPTFCKGWGNLPFDRSCADLTGHALLAFLKTFEMLHDRSNPVKSRMEKSAEKALRWLEKNQSERGSWLPLWFGNQMTIDKTNPAYGTAKVCIYLSDCMNLTQLEKGFRQRLEKLVMNARKYLIDCQNEDGSWGGAKRVNGTIEETSLAVSALSGFDKDACLRGISWLSRQEKISASPIGLYFAMLWYDEKMYPVVYYTEALKRFLNSVF